MIRRSGRAGRRCLRIPPRGEEEQAAEEGEVAGAYPNVGLPAGLACRTATHGPGSLRHACVQAQAMGDSPDGDPDGVSGTIRVSVGASTRGYIMMRRTLVITIFIVIAMACAAAPALAYGPYLSYTVDAGARLVQGTSEATVMWQAPGAGTTKVLELTRYSVDGASHGPVAVVVRHRRPRRLVRDRPGALRDRGVEGRRLRLREEGGPRRRPRLRRHAVHQRDRRPGGRGRRRQRRRLRLVHGSRGAGLGHVDHLSPVLVRSALRRRRAAGAEGDDRRSRRRLDGERLRPARSSRPQGIGRAALRRRSRALGLARLRVQPVRAALGGHAGAHRDHRVVRGDGGLA